MVALSWFLSHWIFFLYKKKKEQEGWKKRRKKMYVQLFVIACIGIVCFAIYKWFQSREKTTFFEKSAVTSRMDMTKEAVLEEENRSLVAISRVNGLASEHVKNELRDLTAQIGEFGTQLAETTRMTQNLLIATNGLLGTNDKIFHAQNQALQSISFLSSIQQNTYQSLSNFADSVNDRLSELSPNQQQHQQQHQHQHYVDDSASVPYGHEEGDQEEGVEHLEVVEEMETNANVNAAGSTTTTTTLKGYNDADRVQSMHRKSLARESYHHLVTPPRADPVSKSQVTDAFYEEEEEVEKRKRKNKNEEQMDTDDAVEDNVVPVSQNHHEHVSRKKKKKEKKNKVVTFSQPEFVVDDGVVAAGAGDAGHADDDGHNAPSQLPPLPPDLSSSRANLVISQEGD